MPIYFFSYPVRLRLRRDSLRYLISKFYSVSFIKKWRKPDEACRAVLLRSSSFEEQGRPDKSKIGLPYKALAKYGVPDRI